MTTGGSGSHAAHDGGHRRGLPAWVARWRAALRIARRDAWRHRGRTAISLAMIGLPVAAAVFLAGFVASSGGTALTRAELQLGPTAQATIADAGCGGCVVEQTPDLNGWGTNGAGAGSPDTGAIEAALGGRGVTLEETGRHAVAAGDRDIGSHSISALPAEALASVYPIREGRTPATSGEAALLHGVADRLGIGIGDTVRVADTDLVVTGILDSRNRTVPDVLTVTGALALAPAGWWVLDDEPVTWADVLAVNTVGATVLSRAVLLDPPPVDPMYAGGSMMTTQTVGVGAAIAAIALIEAVLLVGPAFAVGARRQTHNLALLAATGGSAADLRRTVLSTGVVAGLVAGLGGAVVGTVGILVTWWWTAGGWNPFPALVVPWWAPLGGVAFAVGLGSLAALVPARAAARLDVVAALAGHRADPAARRGVSWLGIGLAVAGLATAAVGGLTSKVGLLVGGIVALEVGVVLLTGGLLSLVARWAPRLGVAGRFALRDAVRQRSRTVPAVASVLAAVAAVTAGAVYVATDEAAAREAWNPSLGTGTITINPDWGAPLEDQEVALTAALTEVAADVPVTGSSVVRALAAETPTVGGPSVYAAPIVRPDRRCPVDESTTQAEYEELVGDPRCLVGRSWSSPFGGSFSDGTLIDDGSAIALIRADGAAEAATALASGHIVVGHPDDVWADGTAHVEIGVADPDRPDADPVIVEVVAPAHLVGWGAGRLVLPPDLVADVPGVSVIPVGAVAHTTLTYDRAWADSITRSVGATSVNVEAPYTSSEDVVTVVLVLVASLVALAATWLSIGLAAAETRPDVATLAAVGAPPRLRRRIVAAQAAVIGVLGVHAGVLLGLALGFVLGRWTLGQSWQVEELLRLGRDVPGVTVPWLWVAGIAVVLPLLAVGGAWLTAPRHLPLVRRLAQ
ncbi:ABC transporter permease [Serinibacter arcticus]|uniref:ABC3 transporter permease C-terminal domain-containing protein n=1 Tax=Serinibacter arcticus TaxID=1655435 RepID=A0A4Z1E6N1_9MICO|nr:ABC transporter permease [Serinibacter arcticus]TGO06362.1 hypothetical protein SERN_0554 [Serinibacter arcticus]